MADTITMPKLGFDMQEGTLVRWVRSEGESIKKGDVLAEIETDKATVEVESSAAGVVRKLLVDQGAVVPIGAPIAIVGTADEKIEASATQSAAAPTTEQPMMTAPQAPRDSTSTLGGVAKASPLARRMARESSIDLGRVQGTGPGGRIVRKDVEAAMRRGAPGMAPTLSAGRSVDTVIGQDRSIPLSRLRQAIARRMTESKTSVPHFYVTHEYRVDALLELRKQANSFVSGEEKLSVNDFVVKAVAMSLRQYKNLNAAFEGDHVIQRGDINVGVAVAVDGGLLTIVCRHADQKSLPQISAELREMAVRARSGKVRPDDVEGSTFTVSNLGMYDVDSFGAIINPPEAAILAVGSARNVAVVEDGQVRPGWRMRATIAVDHRASDGAEAAQFMQALARYLEAPLGMFL